MAAVSCQLSAIRNEKYDVRSEIGDNWMSIYKRLLVLAGISGLLLAVFQVVITFNPAWSLYFGAPKNITDNHPLLFTTGVIAALFFAIFGLYGLSGAGVIRRLPLLRLGLCAISAIFILRGLVIVPQLLIVTGLRPAMEPLPVRFVVSSFISLTIGVIYLVGTAGWWKNLYRVKHI